MRLDGVEVKVTLDGAETAEAVQALDLPVVAPWQIFFVEDVTTGLSSSTPLLDEGLIIRARQKTEDDKDDVTVKLRPGRRSQLTNPWLETTKVKDGGLETELKVEEDWAGDHRTLSVSLTSERPDGLVETVAGGGRGVGDLLSSDQHRFLEQCAGARVNLDVLSVLPAVSARRWRSFSAPGPGGSPLKVRAERWTVLDLDFLELSVVAEVKRAEESQAALTAFVDGLGLTLSDGGAKTTQVLRVLVAEAAGATA
jgi:hypothetical protein